MMNSTYAITLSTPMGQKSGTVTFNDDNGVLSGSLRAMGHDNPFKDGRINGDTFEFQGTLNMGFTKLQYSAKGTVVGDILKANVKTRYGVTQIRGKRI